MSTLDKLRALHQEVCHCWRLQTPRPISEGEAEVLNLGFLLLERFIELQSLPTSGQKWTDNIADSRYVEYVNRVHSQLDSDADIKITEAPHHE